MDLKARQEELGQLRREKDRFFKESHHSPIPDEERASFTGLEYYPYNPDLVLEVELQELDEPQNVVMATSVSGEEVLYHRVGYFEFEVSGQVQRLYAYRSAHEHETGRPTLFIPFRDATSGKETYGAGRYLEVEVIPSGKYVLDFNLAYNPYCAYSDLYVCPLPPSENWLKTEIRAGEKSHPGKR
ncbi:MAG: DUF1684 domain-containing protein [Thermoplasmata archaeon]